MVKRSISHNSLFTATEKAKASAMPYQQRTTQVFTWGLSNKRTDMLYIIYIYMYDLPAVLIGKHICKC